MDDLLALVRERLGEPAELLERDSAALGKLSASDRSVARRHGATRGRQGGAPDRRAGRARPQPQPAVRLARIGGRSRGGRARGGAPAPIPARVRHGRVLHRGSGVHALPWSQHVAWDSAQLPWQPRRGIGVWGLARAVAAASRGAGRRVHRAERVRARAPARAGSAARLGARARAPAAGGIAGGGRGDEVGQLCAGRVATRPGEGSRRGDRGVPNGGCPAGGGGDGPERGSWRRAGHTTPPPPSRRPHAVGRQARRAPGSKTSGNRLRKGDAPARARGIAICASPDTWTTRSWIACAGAPRLRSSPLARPRRSGWRQPRRWRQACRWSRAASARCRSWSSRTGWSIPATPRRSPRRSGAAGATWPRQSVGERACGSCVRRRRWPRGWRGYMG